MQSSIFEVVVPKIDYDQMCQENQKLKLQIQEEKNKNVSMRLRIQQLSNINKNEKILQENQKQMQIKIRTLSKAVLKASRHILSFSDKPHKSNQEKINRLKIINQVVSQCEINKCIKQMGRKKLDEIFQKEEKKDMPVNQISTDLDISSKKIQKNWGLSLEFIKQRTKCIEASQKIYDKKLLQKKIDHLLNEIEETKYTLINQRNIVQKFKQQLSTKEKDYLYLQQRMAHQSLEFQQKEKLLEEKYISQKRNLEAQFTQKIKSLKDFGSVLQQDSKIKRIQDEKVELLKKLQKKEKIIKQKENIIEYMNQIFESMKQIEDNNVEKAVEFEVNQYKKSIFKENRKEQKQKVDNKLIQIRQRVSKKIDEFSQNKS